MNINDFRRRYERGDDEGLMVPIEITFDEFTTLVDITTPVWEGELRSLTDEQHAILVRLRERELMN